jgi:hypothetical protein
MFSYLRHAAVAPLWGIQLLSQAKSFEGNAIIGNTRLNEWGLHEQRVALAYRIAQMRRRRLENLIAREDRAIFERDGYVVRHDFLAPETFTTLHAQLRDYKGPIRQKTEGSTVLRKLSITAKLLEQVPALRQVRENPTWQGLIRYAGARNIEPETSIQSVTQHPASGEQDPQTVMHADTFHPTAKAWLFLTDVAKDEGPFTYVPGSHKLTPARLAWEAEMSLKARYSDDHETRQGSFRIETDELGQLGLPTPIAVDVPANTLVVADTFGFHARGLSVRPSHRVEVWGIAPRSPFLPWGGLDSIISSADSYLGAAPRVQTGSNWGQIQGISILEPARN